MEKILGLISDLMLLVFALLTMIFSLLVTKNFYLNNELINEYLNNWNNGPILDIVATNLANCPDGYTNFLAGNYPGSYPGCNCVNSIGDTHRHVIFNQTCTREMIIDKCTIVFPTEQIDFTIWRGKKLCILRLKSNFWKLELTSSTSTCPIGQKNCGILDSFNNILCVNSASKCPINTLEILPNNQVPKYINYNKIQLNNNYNLYFASRPNSTNQIIINIYPAKEICAHPLEGILGENNYPLNKHFGPDHCVTKINNVLVDKRFSNFDNLMLVPFYNENNITPSINKLPYYPVPTKDDSTNLFKVNYFGWNRKCFDNPTLKMTNYTEMSDPSIINKYFSKSYTNTVFCILHFAYAVSMVLIYKMIISGFNISHRSIIYIDLVNFLFLIVIFGMAIYVNGVAATIVSPYQQFIDLACGDPITNGVISLMSDGMVNVLRYSKPIIILTSIEIIYLIGFYVYYIWKVKEILDSKRH